MEIARHGSMRLSDDQPVPALQLPLHLHFMLGLLLSVIVIVAGALVLTRLMQPPPDPFAAYADILPGHPKQAALEHGFTCFTNMFDDSTSCTRRDEPAFPLFSRVHLSTLGDHIYTLSFTPYVNTLTIGDLVLLWGRPTIQRSGRAAKVSWSSLNVTAIAVLSSGQPPNYFTSVAYIAFTAV